MARSLFHAPTKRAGPQNASAFSAAVCTLRNFLRLQSAQRLPAQARRRVHPQNQGEPQSQRPAACGLKPATSLGGSAADSNTNPRFGFANRGSLREIFRFLCFFVAYLVVVQVFGAIYKPGRLLSALLQFVPYCVVLVGIVYSGRTLARFDKQTLLMASCLTCVFIVFGLDVTKNVTWFVGVPILGEDSRVRNDIATLAIIVAIASFPAAGYLMMQEILLAKRQVDEQVEKLQEALRHLQRLQGLLPICMYCHKNR